MLLCTILNLTRRGFNSRRFTEQDFYDICLDERIEVVRQIIPTSYYMALLGRKVIALPKSFRGLRLEFAMFHELGHHFLHGDRATPVSAFAWMEGGDEEQEREANEFASIALYPRHEFGPIVPDAGLAKHIYGIRMNLLRTRGA